MTFEFDELIHLFRILSFQYWLHTHTVVISDSILGVWTCFSWPLFSGFRSFFRGQNVEIFSGWTWRLIFNLSDYTTGRQGPMQPWNAGMFEARPAQRWEYLHGVTDPSPAKSVAPHFHQQSCFTVSLSCFQVALFHLNRFQCLQNPIHIPTRPLLAKAEYNHWSKNLSNHRQNGCGQYALLEQI